MLLNEESYVQETCPDRAAPRLDGGLSGNHTGTVDSHVDCVQFPDQPTEWRPRIPRQAAPFMDWASCAQRTPPAARTCFSSSVQLITARKRPPWVPRRSMMNRPSRVTS